MKIEIKFTIETQDGTLPIKELEKFTRFMNTEFSDLKPAVNIASETLSATQSAMGNMVLSNKNNTIPEAINHIIPKNNLQAQVDPLVKDALKVALDMGYIAASLIQRKLGLGYTRAARIIDYLEQQEYIGPAIGVKPREVLITKERFLKLFG